MQEYVSAMTGYELGEYWQISTNLHMYCEHYDMMSKKLGNGSKIEDSHHYEAYGQTSPLIIDPEYFDEELIETMDYIDDMNRGLEVYSGNISSPFFQNVVIPMANAHWRYKCKDMKGALDELTMVSAPDWQTAGIEWVQRRIK
jgi:hypothetical protein